MIKRIISIFTIVLSACFFSACHIYDAPAPLEYAYDIFGMDFPIKKQIYLANNLWYVDPMNIDAMNYHTGKIIPFGTEVEFVQSDPNSLTFRIKGQAEKTYRVINDPEITMNPDKDMFNDLFTTEDPMNELKNVSPDIIDKMKKGLVEPGMTRSEVRCAMGLPPKEINPLSQVTWAYFANKDLKVIHVIFKDDTVTFVF